MDNNSPLSPFYLVDVEGSCSICLTCEGVYKREVFDKYDENGFCGGNGYDWEGVARVFVEENMPDLEIDYDSEAGMFCALFESKEDAERFVLAFKKAIDDDTAFDALVSQAEPE
jgi:hypothetical protein